MFTGIEISRILVAAFFGYYIGILLALGSGEYKTKAQFWIDVIPFMAVICWVRRGYRKLES